MTIHLWEINSKAANRRKLKNYNGSTKTIENSVKKKRKLYVANTPKVGLQTKNSSTISKNSNASDPKQDYAK